MGICANGTACGGATLSTCETDCETNCPREILMVRNCTENWLDNKYEGKCRESVGTGTVLCGTETVDLNACKTSCESSCYKFPQIIMYCHEQ